MSEGTLDCRGMSCPQPVVEAKKRLDQISEGSVNVLIDNETAKNNLVKLAGSLDLEVVVREENAGFAVSIHKKGGSKREPAKHIKSLLLLSDTMGRPDEQLGKLLIKSFLYALAENERLPDNIYLVNAAVRLSCEGSSVLESLEKLSLRGVKVSACGLCLDFFQLKESLRVGEATNMYAIVEALMDEDALVL